MDNFKDNSQDKLPIWLIVGAVFFTVIGLLILAAIEISYDYRQSWLTLLIVALIYVPIQIVTEVIFSIYWESHTLLIKIIPIVFLIVFYWAVLSFR